MPSPRRTAIHAISVRSRARPDMSTALTPSDWTGIACTIVLSALILVALIADARHRRWRERVERRSARRRAAYLGRSPRCESRARGHFAERRPAVGRGALMAWFVVLVAAPFVLAFTVRLVSLVRDRQRRRRNLRKLARVLDRRLS